jgi:ElaA protein
MYLNMAHVILKKTFSELSNEELYQIIDLRLRVFVEEQKILYADTDFKDQKCMHYFIMDQNNIISYLRVLPAGLKYKEHALGRVATDERYRKQGMATALLLEAMHDLKGHPIRISGQVYLKDYYEKFGFITVSEVYLEEERPHIEMLALNV